MKQLFVSAIGVAAVVAFISGFYSNYVDAAQIVPVPRGYWLVSSSTLKTYQRTESLRLPTSIDFEGQQLSSN